MGELVRAEVHGLRVVEGGRQQALSDLTDTDAEVAVLGAVLLDAGRPDGVVSVVRGALGADAWAGPGHAAIWTAMLAVVDRGDGLDVISLAAELRARGCLNAVGGAQTIAALTEAIPTIAHAPSHARHLADLAARRRLSTLGAALAVRARDLGRSTLDLRDAAARAIRDVSVPGVAAPTIGADLESVWRRVEAVAAGTEAPDIPTGLPDLDRIMSGGWVPGYLHLLAARPRVGKTALAVQTALHVAERTGPVYLLSLEIGAEDLARQSIACLGSVDHGRLRRAELTDEEMARAIHASDRLARIPIHRADMTTPACPRSVAELAAAVEALPTLPTLIVVDHVGKLRAAGRHRERRDSVAEVSAGLVELARRTGVAVLALAHISRAGADRPTLGDLAESDDLGRDADVILLLHRDDIAAQGVGGRAPQGPTPEPGVGAILCAKRRGAEPGRAARLRLRGEFQRWEGIQDDHSFGPMLGDDE